MKKAIWMTSISGVLSVVAIGRMQENAGIPELKVYALDSSGKKIDSAVVDVNNIYSFKNLKPGTYDFLMQKAGYTSVKLAGIEHLSKNIQYRSKISLFQSGTKSIDLHTEDIKDMSEVAITKSSLSVHTSRAMRGVRSDASVATTDVASTLEDRESDASSSVKMSLKGGSGPSVKSGQITAGIWSDLQNWDKWEKTTSDATVAQYNNDWNFYTNKRFSIKVKDKNGKPMIGIQTTLIENSNKEEFKSVTDNNGEAELWANLNSQITTKEVKRYKVQFTFKEKTYQFDISASGTQSEFALPVESTVNPIADIAFVVDATGSMGDEIDYLQAELLDVINRVKKQNTCIDLNIGSVFYRDKGDEYLTRKSDFSNDPTQAINFIFDQSAGGGGDFPEAVDDAMNEAVNGLSWRNNAISKIIFLVLDAPPHNDKNSVSRMNEITRQAAAKGIKIIPVTASGINQSTEFLMKYMAIATNGKYIYITDHSGIGGTHHKPTGVKEDVQYLNDLMVETISENLKWEGCEKVQDTATNADPKGTVEIVANGQWQVQFYPNPAVDEIMVKSNELCDAISIFDMSGKEVLKQEQISGKKVVLNVQALQTGVYFVKCRKGSEQITCRMLIMK